MAAWRVRRETAFRFRGLILESIQISEVEKTLDLLLKRAGRGIERFGHLPKALQQLRRPGGKEIRARVFLEPRVDPVLQSVEAETWKPLDQRLQAAVVGGEESLSTEVEMEVFFLGEPVVVARAFLKEHTERDPVQQPFVRRPAGARGAFPFEPFKDPVEHPRIIERPVTGLRFLDPVAFAEGVEAVRGPCKIAARHGQRVERCVGDPWQALAPSLPVEDLEIEPKSVVGDQQIVARETLEAPGRPPGAMASG